MRITVEIEETELENDHGRMIPGVIATCRECNHTTESFGQHSGSRRRCLALMREECPMGESHFYADSSED